MHRCLQIREILLEVFELVFTSENPYPELARLARTCRSFHEPAIDLLWYEQPSLLPLVMCFPREILDFSETRAGSYALGTVVRLQSASLFYAGSVTSLKIPISEICKNALRSRLGKAFSLREAYQEGDQLSTPIYAQVRTACKCLANSPGVVPLHTVASKSSVSRLRCHNRQLRCIHCILVHVVQPKPAPVPYIPMPLSPQLP
ncbi:hypothetical protein PAXINDRAFT_92362 [Paxillus involutus ATCC 200175]|uniref:F-box domain-containing protein n=1 Tax=Paxillus involutus ATCC 200175 TaxID=664439 RepID=A0A0C9TDE9_PAXIN|nr:hypothetical protein PAXINDRAFT_92362 [Paxillus involutus ATCC 200175]